MPKEDHSFGFCLIVPGSAQHVGPLIKERLRGSWVTSKRRVKVVGHHSAHDGAQGVFFGATDLGAVKQLIRSLNPKPLIASVVTLAGVQNVTLGVEANVYLYVMIGSAFVTISVPQFAKRVTTEAVYWLSGRSVEDLFGTNSSGYKYYLVEAVATAAQNPEEIRKALEGIAGVQAVIGCMTEAGQSL